MDAGLVAKELGEKLVAADLSLVIAFADCAIDQSTLARETSKIFGAVPVVGCTTRSVLGPTGATVTAIGLYNLRVGIGIATELCRGAQPRTRLAVEHAAAGLGLACEALDPARHVMVTIFEGSGHMDEVFCFASAAAAPQLRVVGGAASQRFDGSVRRIWANGEALADAGIVLLLEPNVKFEVMMSSHVVPTELRCVVTGARARRITELDGQPAIRRFSELIGKLGGTLGPHTPSEFTFARVIEGQPYVRGLAAVLPDALELGCTVDTGHVLRIMRSGDLVEHTTRELAALVQRVTPVSAVLAFSCTLRGSEAKARGLTNELARAFDTFPATVLECFGEQYGMLFVNHTLTALALGGGDGG